MYLPFSSNYRILTDRIVFSPVFLVITLYLLSRLQGVSHGDAVQVGCPTCECCRGIDSRVSHRLVFHMGLSC
jgi:hypothetical protein